MRCCRRIHAAASPPPAAAAPQQQSEIELSITGEPGAPPKYAVPDFIALSPRPGNGGGGEDHRSRCCGTTSDFEREFYLIPRDTYASIPPARSLSDVPFDRWRELGADGLVIGTVQKNGQWHPARSAPVQRPVPAVGVRPRVQRSARTIRASSRTRSSDEVHQQQRALRGVARTKLTFSSDRDGERVQGTVERRDVKEMYIADYDGANQRRVTVNRALNIMPTWSPDGTLDCVHVLQARLSRHLSSR